MVAIPRPSDTLAGGVLCKIRLPGAASLRLAYFAQRGAFRAHPRRANGRISSFSFQGRVAFCGVSGPQPFHPLVTAGVGRRESCSGRRRPMRCGRRFVGRCTWNPCDVVNQRHPDKVH